MSVEPVKIVPLRRIDDVCLEPVYPRGPLAGSVICGLDKPCPIHMSEES